MAYRDVVATWGLDMARWFGQTLGCELVVETSSHSIETTMEVPDKDNRAWDPHQFKRGQMYVSGYANPVKPKVRHHTELEDPDTVDIEESDPVGALKESYVRGELEEDEFEKKVEQVLESENEDGDTGYQSHIQLISSGRYQSYMRQDLISQLLNPRAQWKLIAYAVIGLAGLALINTMLLLRIVGVF